MSAKRVPAGFDLDHTNHAADRKLPTLLNDMSPLAAQWLQNTTPLSIWLLPFSCAQVAIRLVDEETPSRPGASNDMDTLCCRRIMNGRTQQAVYATNKVQKPHELVAIVDEQNNVIGQATRQEMRSQNAIHRCSFTIVLNSKDEVFVQKRVSFKETYPGFYDPAPGGVVGANESYELNAERELEEEMGVLKAQLQHCFDFYHADKVTRLWGRLFTCTYDGPMKLDPEEVESGQFMSWAEVRQLLQTQHVTPDSKACVEQYLQQHAK